MSYNELLFCKVTLPAWQDNGWPLQQQIYVTVFICKTPRAAKCMWAALGADGPARTQSSHRTSAGNIQVQAVQTSLSELRPLICWAQHARLTMPPLLSPQLLCPQSCFGSHMILYATQALRTSSFHSPPLSSSYFLLPTVFLYTGFLCVKPDIKNKDVTLMFLMFLPEMLKSSGGGFFSASDLSDCAHWREPKWLSHHYLNICSSLSAWASVGH